MLESERTNIPTGCNPYCRACSHISMTMTQSLLQKQNFLERKLNEWSYVLHPIQSVGEEKRLGYRTSVTLAAKWDGDRWMFGTKSFDEVIPIHDCPIHSKLVNQTVDLLTNTLPPFEKFPLAFLVLSKAQCTLIIKGKLSSVDWFDAKLHNELQTIGIKGFWLHFNPSAGRRLFEKGGWMLLYGEKYSFDALGLVYAPTSFQQQIPELYLASLSQAEQFLNCNSNSAVVDLYCGTGTSLARWDKMAVRTLGVETGGDALDCARINAPNATLLRGACRLRLPQIVEWSQRQMNLGKELLLYANPPRTGIESEVLQWIAVEGKPERMAYLSCSPGTLGKNLHFLSNNGYKVIGLYPYDFFPYTHHVECLALLQKG